MDRPLFLQEIMPQLCRGLNIDLFENELRLVREIEKTMNPDEVFEEKWKIAASGDRHALARYHSKLLSKRINKINESINKLSEEQYNRINSELEQFRSVITGILTPIYEHLNLVLNEQGSLPLTADAAKVVDFSKLDSAASAAASSGGGWTITGVLNSILKALTGNYSPLGILQLALDVVGMIGDFIIPGLGMAADLINALIYLASGEYVLMAISLISIVPGIGDASKIFKPVAAPLQKMLAALFKKNSKEAAEVASRVPQARSFLADWLLPALAKIGSIFVSVARAINGLLNYLLSWLPGGWGGGYVKKFFKWIDDQLVRFKSALEGVDATAKKALADAATLAKAVDPDMAKEISNISSKILKEGGTVVQEGGEIIFKAADGKTVLGKFPADQVLNKQAFDAKFPGAKPTTKTREIQSTILDPSTGKPFVTKIDETIWAYTVAKTKSTPKFVRWLSGKLSRKWNNRLVLIKLGKWIYQYMTAGNPDNLKIEGTPIPALDDADYAYVSAAALTDYVQQTISQRKDQTGEIYNPTVVFNSMDMDEKNGFDFTQSYLRDMARKTGQPSIIPVIYDKYKNEMEPELEGAMEETFASLIAKEEKEKAEAKGSRETSTFNKKDEIEIEGIEIEEAYSRYRKLSPFSKFK